MGCRARERWWRISAPHFVAGLLVRDGIVVEAAPILGWALTQGWPYVRARMVRYGWHGEPLPSRPDDA